MFFKAVSRVPLWRLKHTYFSCGRYIERNPVAAGLTEEPWMYRWSSCRAYAVGEGDPLLASNP